MNIRDYLDNVDRTLAGMIAESVGLCPGCEECADEMNFDTVAEFNEAYDNGFYDEGAFSHRPCGICQSTLGGDRYIWHWVGEKTGELHHESDCCTDCAMLLANGELPDLPGLDEYLDGTKGSNR